MKSHFAHRVIPMLVSSLVLAALLLAAVPVTSAFAGDCDGTAGPDTITCSADPTTPDDIVGLDLGDDSLVVDSGVTTGHVNGDGQATGGRTTGNGGNDTIVINGSAFAVSGDLVTAIGGNDTITINGTADAVAGDNSDGLGGDDTITINGVVANNVYGDFGLADGGSDTITINGEVSGSVYGDDSLGAGGNDTVILGTNAIVGGTIDGGLGTDTLSFDTLTQAQVDALGLNPAGDSTTINGNTYTWLNFETLLGLLEELAERGLRVFFAGASAVAVETPEGDGIRIFGEPGRIAAISYAALSSLGIGESATYSTPNSAGWYVVVTNLGADPDHAGKTLYQVNIYAAGGSSAGQFTFSN